MNHHQFNPVAQALIRCPSRRDVVRGLMGVGLAIGTLRLSHAADAKKRKGKKTKKKQHTPQPVVNAFGCLDIGQRCRGDSSLCCSGVCAGRKPKKGKRDRRVCAAHNAADCSEQRNRCTSTNPITAVCNLPDLFSSCLVTTGNAPFCGSLFEFDSSVHCQACTRDADCLGLGFPAGSACVQLGGQYCNGCEATQNRACLPPAVLA